ncbi:hypothetical protein M0804_003884 [Polistes exclamans]|nr:hypothetical protein M0804_003884 [Polistes exclamans]
MAGTTMHLIINSVDTRGWMSDGLLLGGSGVVAGVVCCRNVADDDDDDDNDDDDGVADGVSASNGGGSEGTGREVGRGMGWWRDRGRGRGGRGRRRMEAVWRMLFAVGVRISSVLENTTQLWVRGRTEKICSRDLELSFTEVWVLTGYSGVGGESVLHTISSGDGGGGDGGGGLVEKRYSRSPDDLSLPNSPSSN